ncbi:uncharacterized protein PAC_00122 [Phialocephala subalpina]|uniref:Zn(2)-C6 fungal-type domain-containing protein n=1 Tax=Phialocephala subalpina TaxID=576137 RepID=A0A1L7WBV4_9HELO|nr:uncharacterized protein PAC_00122 [Phialocephala subalpina]
MPNDEALPKSNRDVRHASQSTLHLCSRGICLTCSRVRRIKCDEKRPACANCSNTGRACDGYPPSFEFRAVTINPQSKTALAPSSASTPVPRTMISLERHQSSDLGNENNVSVGTPLRQPEILPGTTQEQQFFIVFRQNVAPTLGGYFDTDFWNTQIPRVAYSEPAVFHATIAIAALDHYDASNPDTLGSEQQVSFLLHYNKAIQFVKHQIQNEGSSQLVILLTCLLFICLEFKRGNTDVALKHLQNGLSILHSQHRNHEPSELSDIRQKLSNMFSRLGIQGSLVGQQPPPGSPLNLNASQPVSVPFANIGEARNHLISLFIESLRPSGPNFTFEASFSTLSSEQARRATLISQLHQHAHDPPPSHPKPHRYNLELDYDPVLRWLLNRTCIRRLYQYFSDDPLSRSILHRGLTE